MIIICSIASCINIRFFEFGNSNIDQNVDSVEKYQARLNSYKTKLLNTTDSVAQLSVFLVVDIRLLHIVALCTYSEIYSIVKVILLTRVFKLKHFSALMYNFQFV